MANGATEDGTDDPAIGLRANPAVPAESGEGALKGVDAFVFMLALPVL